MVSIGDEKRNRDRQTILSRLHEEIDQLPNALARIAKYILENPEKVLRQSVAELGEFAGSGEASILRLCRQIGFTGFRDFKLALAAEVGRPQLAVVSSSGADPAIDKLQRTLIENLEVAHSHVDLTSLDRIAEALATARRIDIYGAGMSGFVAEMLAYRLLRVGLTALAFRNSHMAHEVANGLGEGCVAVAFSVSGLTVETVQFLKGARAAGATTVAVTNRTQSPLSKAAHYSLQASGLHDNPFGGTLTPVAGKIFVIECLMLALDKHLNRPMK
ncbi:DNA-binding MurR/RpiR family transcriptional regulator [Rhizobium mesoamericanum]|uniref:MurR/RpiR family transcriptional regulator n=1 Tax=Rhizobium mesoamericanum TaxID=1079800 RepID=UPI0027867453|nr:MurR/RpiR family transcriptional regulator [Rhizobium mesoamericanum]MDQ0562274.1 DNA-binding MurR/RpiR family transcriptional regulator [Rhizobium mesoamericanum]